MFSPVFVGLSPGLKKNKNKKTPNLVGIMVSAWDRAFLSCGVGLDKVRDPQTFSRFL